MNPDESNSWTSKPALRFEPRALFGWPATLQWAFWGELVATVVGTLQLYHWIFVTRQLFPPFDWQGIYAIAAYLLAIGTLLAVIAGARRTFVVFAFATSFLHVVVTCLYLDLPWRLVWTGDWRPRRQVDFSGWWNALVFCFHLVICRLLVGTV